MTVAVRGPSENSRESMQRLLAALENVTVVRASDPAMVKAKAQARATLDDFWRAMARPGPSEEGFALKVAMSKGLGPREHVWVEDIERKDRVISGVLVNDPLTLGMRGGQRIEFQESQITDWTFMRLGKIMGSYTMRPLLKHLPPDEAARYRAMLAPEL